MSKVIVYSVIGVLSVALPVGAGIFAINNKFGQLESKLTEITNYINKSQKTKAVYSLSRGVFNTQGIYEISFNDEYQTKIDVEFTIRHGVESIFNKPIVIQTESKISSNSIKANDYFLITKTRYYPYYADTEYKFGNLSFVNKNSDQIFINNFAGNVQYTFGGKKIEHYGGIEKLELLNNKKENTVLNKIQMQNKFKFDSPYLGDFYVNIGEIDLNKKLSLKALDFNYVGEENAQDKSKYNFMFNQKGEASSNSFGESSINTKFNLSNISSDAIKNIYQNLLKLNFHKNDDLSAEQGIAKEMLKALSEGFIFDANQNIETKKIGSFKTNMNGQINASKGDVSLKDQMKIKGNFTHRGIYVDYLYSLSNNLGIGMVKSQTPIYSVNFSYDNDNSVINSTIVTKEIYSQLVMNLIQQLINLSNEQNK